MTARLTQAEVEARLAEHWPDFVPADGWVYVNNRTPIPGSCRVCESDCSPMVAHLRSGSGYCSVCGHLARASKQSAHGKSEILRLAAEKNFKVLSFFVRSRKSSRGPSFCQKVTWALLRCFCGHEWSASQSNLSLGHGCPSCAKSGFDSAKPADLYLLTRNKRGLQETQYGVSNRIDGRLAEHERNGWRLVDVISGDGVEILALEKLIKDAMKAEGIYRREYHDEKYDGYTEAWDARDGLRPFMSLDYLLAWAASVDAREGALV